MKSGKVFLVGAGPGNPGLLTLKGLECISRADVIVYDRLLNEHLLDSALPGAEKIYVGKTLASHTIPQTDINRLLVQKAKEGKNIVRLKGGDPFVLGRGGEEAEELSKNHIDFEIVPGVTSASAVPAYAGIPVTHRAVASSFAVVTGHEDPSKVDSKIRWSKLATGVDTLIFLMGMQNLPGIVAKLVEHGRSSETPIALIKDGTGPRQKVVAGTLKNIVTLAKEDGMSPPAVVVVGEVVKFREKLRWFDNRPLFGKRVLVTRPGRQANTMSKLLIEKGAEPVELPAITIQKISDNKELKHAILNLKQYQWVVFTSVNGVEFFFEDLGTLQLDSRALGGVKVGAIGPVTTSILAENGIVADCQPSVFTGRELVVEMGRRDLTGQHILLPRADIADDEITKGLIGLGAKVKEIPVYKTTPDVKAISKVKEMLLSNQLDVITFTSSSAVASLASALEGDFKLISGVKVACIGPKTTETAIRAGVAPDVVADEHTIAGLVEALEEYFRKEA